MRENDGIRQVNESVCFRFLFRSPLSQHEVVGLDVGVHNADGVQLLHRVQDAGCQEHDQRRRQHLLAQRPGDVDGVLRRGTRPGEEDGQGEASADDVR